MKLDRIQPIKPATISTMMADHDSNGTASTITDAKPVLFKAVPKAKPPATIHSTCQSTFAKSSLVKIPSTAKIANGNKAMMFEFSLVNSPVIHSKIVPRNTNVTTQKCQSFLASPSILISIFVALNG